MIEHVRRRCLMVDDVDDVIVATCDREVADTVTSAGGICVMTADSHVCASDRVAEAAAKLSSDIVVMVQGDELTINPDAVLEALGPMREDPDVDCVNLMAPIRSVEEVGNPELRKSGKTECWGNALFMSRQPIPYGAPMAVAAFKQVCVIPFRREALRKFAALAPTPLEVAESIDMLRFLEHGVPVRMVQTDHSSQAVDRPEDVRLVENLLMADPLTRDYL